MELESRTLKAGTVVKMNGIPLVLTKDAELETNPANWSLALQALEYKSSQPSGYSPEES